MGNGRYFPNASMISSTRATLFAFDSELLAPVLKCLLRETVKLHNTAADSSRYASTLHGVLARNPRPGAPTLRSRPPSRSPHLQIESENRSCSLAAEQACEKWTLTKRASKISCSRIQIP